MKYNIALISLSILLISCGKKDLPVELTVQEPEVIRINQDLTSISFVPNNYEKFIYIKDSKTAYNNLQENPLYQATKDNYLFLDLKYNYLENVDMFFTKFNFDFNSIFKYISNDVSFGVNDDSFFLIASMTWESKIIVSLLNVAPDSIIGETTYKDFKLYNVKKSNSSIYYCVVNNYIAFCDTQEGLQQSVDSLFNKENKLNTIVDTVDKEEVLYVSKVDEYNNPFKLFPAMSEVQIKYNIVSQNVSYKSKPVRYFEGYKDREDARYHETLKYFNKDTPLVMYNSSYDFKNILSNLIYEEDTSELSEIINNLDEQLGGVYFLADNIEQLNNKKDPGLGLILNLKEALADPTSILTLTTSILGITWSEGLVNKDVTTYKSEDSSFNLVVSPNNIAIFTNKDLALDYTNRINNPEFSLYDLHKESFYNDNSALDSFICYNPLNIKKISEQLIKRYVFSTIHMGEEEYNKSFGQIIDQFSKLKVGYMDYIYNPEKEEFNGSIKKLP